MAIGTLDQLIAALGAAPERSFWKASQVTEGAGTYHSLWKAAGFPQAGATPPAFGAGAGYVPSAATLGALRRPNPAGGSLGYLAKLIAQASIAGKLVIYDRLWACSGFDMNSVALQSIVAPGLVTRPDALGDRVELWGEFYAAPGAAGTPTVTVNYTDQDGNPGAATYTRPAANAESVGQMVPFVLAAGDTGVRGVIDLQLSGGTGAVGDFGLTLLRRVVSLPLSQANVPQLLDSIALALAKLDNDACLALKVLCSAGTTGDLAGGYVAVEG